MMNAAQVRLNQNLILTNLLLGLGQGSMIAERVFPRLPQALTGITLAKLGNESKKRYNLRRAPGTATKRVDITYEGVVYKVEQYSVDIPIPRELIRESEAMKTMNVGSNLQISQVAMRTASDILALDYELEAASVATSTGSYAAGHTVALAGGAKWSAATGTPVTDVRAAAETIRKKIGKRPNLLVLSADALQAVSTNVEVRAYLSNTQTGPATIDQLKTIFNVKDIVIGDAIWIDAAGVGTDVWGNNAALIYSPMIGGSGSDISLAEPGFGFTNVLEGHPFAEQPYPDAAIKSWVFGATFERKANLAYAEAGFLFQNPK